MDNENRRIGSLLILVIGLIAAGWLMSAGNGAGQEAVSSRAYVGHLTDADMKSFIRLYPAAAGTRLDDCQTCHRGGARGTDTEKEVSPCSYCHLLIYPNPKYKTGIPADYEETLNPYGLDYKKAGRRFESLAAIAARDSDGDGHPNDAEIADRQNPGDPSSRPGLLQAPTVIFGWDEIRKLPVYRQFMLMNTTKEPTDDYVEYTGVRVIDLLAAAKVSLAGATGITVFAPDGYSVDYSLEDINTPFPNVVFYGEPRAFQGSDRAFVKYPASLPPGVTNLKIIPTQPWLLLAYVRDGLPLDQSVYEKGTGKLDGEGPYRLVKPQRDLSGDPGKPGRPDRPQKAGPFGDGWDFVAGMDHNAGASIRGACVIRVNPMPEGYEEYDWKNGWPLIVEKKIVIFGRGIR